jgi:hypothetical protein
MSLPYTLNSLVLYSEDHNLAANESSKQGCGIGGPLACREVDSRKDKIKAAISGKFGKYKRPEKFVSSIQSAEGVKYSDNIVDLEVEELTNRGITFQDGKNFDTHWLKVSYSPAENGPYQSQKSKNDYIAYVNVLKTKHPIQVQTKPTNPFPF